MYPRTCESINGAWISGFGVELLPNLPGTVDGLELVHALQCGSGIYTVYLWKSPVVARHITVMASLATEDQDQTTSSEAAAAAKKAR